MDRAVFEENENEPIGFIEIQTEAVYAAARDAIIQDRVCVQDFCFVVAVGDNLVPVTAVQEKRRRVSGPLILRHRCQDPPPYAVIHKQLNEPARNNALPYPSTALVDGADCSSSPHKFPAAALVESSYRIPDDPADCTNNEEMAAARSSPLIPDDQAGCTNNEERIHTVARRYNSRSHWLLAVVALLLALCVQQYMSFNASILMLEASYNASHNTLLLELQSCSDKATQPDIFEDNVWDGMEMPENIRANRGAQDDWPWQAWERRQQWKSYPIFVALVGTVQTRGCCSYTHIARPECDYSRDGRAPEPGSPPRIFPCMMNQVKDLMALIKFAKSYHPDLFERVYNNALMHVGKHI